MFPRVITFAINRTVSSLQTLVKMSLVFYVVLVIQAHAMVLSGPLGLQGHTEIVHGGPLGLQGHTEIVHGGPLGLKSNTEIVLSGSLGLHGDTEVIHAGTLGMHGGKDVLHGDKHVLHAHGDKDVVHVHGGKDVENVTAKSGTKLRLSCATVVEPGGMCQWTKDGFGLGPDPAVPGWPRYFMLDCHLLVEPVLPQDEGVYVCQVGGIQGRSPRAATPVRVKVVTEPGTPHIQQAKDKDVVTVGKGSLVELNCESGGGNPAAEIMWTSTHVNDNIENVENVHIDVTHVISHIEPSKDGRAFKTSSTLKFVPKKSVSVRCSAFSEEFQHPRTSGPLEIRLKTKPSIEMVFDKVNIVEGDTIKIQCADHNSQEDLIYSWFVNNLEMEGIKENVLQLNSVTRRQNNAQIKCVVSNLVGWTEVTRTLEVKFSPSIISEPLSQNVDLGETVALNCEAEGNPTPKYIWTSFQSGKLVGQGPNLSLVASVETEGQYLCKAYSDGFQSVTSSPAKISVNYQPKVSAELVSYANIGRDVVLKCKVHSSSEHTKVMWTKNEEPIEANSTKYQLVQVHKDNDLIQSDLMIQKLCEEDFGKYGCFASNKIGSDYITISVKRKEASGYSAIIIKQVREGKQVKKGVIHPIYKTTVMPSNKNEDRGLLDKLLLENDTSEKTYGINMAVDSSFR